MSDFWHRWPFLSSLHISSNHSCRKSPQANVTHQDTIFDPSYHIQSAALSNAINLEVPLPPLLSALRSTTSSNTSSASIRLTKRDGAPYLVVTIKALVERWGGGRDAGPGAGTGFGFGGSNSNHASRRNGNSGNGNNIHTDQDHDTAEDFDFAFSEPNLLPHRNVGVRTTTGAGGGVELQSHAPRETVITLDIPVRVLSTDSVSNLHEPRCREPDVHIVLPPLSQLKIISERFNRLAAATSSSALSGGSGNANAKNEKPPRLELAATMHGELRLGLRTDGLRIKSQWTGLTNPELDPGAVEGGEEGVRAHPSTRMRERVSRGAGGGREDGGAAEEEGENEEDDDDEDMLERGWASVRIDGRDWQKVLSVGRLGGRVIACECSLLPLCGRFCLRLQAGQSWRQGLSCVQLFSSM